jgi:hypothetical protein
LLGDRLGPIAMAKPELLISGFLASPKDRNPERRRYECALRSGRFLLSLKIDQLAKECAAQLLKILLGFSAWST